MTPHKRTKFEYQRDLLVISKLYLHGHTQTEIASKLPELTGAKYTLSQRQISYDLKKLLDKWQRENAKTFNEKIMLELARIDAELRKINEVEEQARESFLKSKEKSIKKSKEVRAGEIEGGGKVSKLSHTQEERYGNPKFLEVMLNCSVARTNLGIQRRKLLGLDGAIKLEISQARNNFEHLSINELNSKIKELENQLFDE